MTSADTSFNIPAFARALRTSRQNGQMWANVLFDQVLVSGTSFVTTVLIGRVLGKGQLGLYVLVYSVVIVLLEVQNSFIASPYTIHSPRLDQLRQAQHTGNALGLSIGLAAVATHCAFSRQRIFLRRFRSG